ncbi:hypothetical protein F4821DRAFT_95163 [Hypoxylon rubiginosum]|uniref:Uncharacterized protein n=1 Tax=Hypoxylon rubiginosum TaxID=110542 RepID=A0ACC0D673_9PEZI|nr:hypothetical protein F4821DRAFT_95163 [Hypoxylon rubiginosum]
MSLTLTLEARIDATPTASFVISSPSPSSSVSSSQLWSSQATSEPGSLASSGQSSIKISSDSPNPNPGSNTNAIVGSVIGGLAVLGIIAIAALYLLLRYRRREAEKSTHEEKDIEESPSHTSTIKQGGWGPSELPTYHSALSQRPPVELPAETVSHYKFRRAEAWERDAHSKSWFIND